MKRPLLLGLVVLVAGILAGRFLNSFFSLSVFFVLIIILSVLYMILTNWKGCFFYIIVAILGVVLTKSALLPKDVELDRFVQNEAMLTVGGVVESISTASVERQKIKFKALSYRYYKQIYKTNVKMQVTLPKGIKVENGQQITIEGTPKYFETRRNQGSFNEFLYYKSRGFEYKCSARVTEKGIIIKSPSVYIEKLRNRLANIYDVCLPEKEAGVAKAMIIGDTNDLDPELSALYRKAGIYHILSISGLHISIIVIAIGKIFSMFLNQRSAAVLTLFFIAFYCLLTGMGVPTIRSAIMCSVVIMGKLLYRQRDFLTSISFAAFSLLLYQPLYFWDVGFQYSFLGVYSLAIGMPALNAGFDLVSSRFPKAEKYIKSRVVAEYFGGSLIATLITLPVVIHNFYYIWPYSIMSNMVVLPTLCVTTLSGFLIGIVGLFFIEAAVFISGIYYTIIKAYEYICIFFSSLPMAEILIGSVSYFIIGFCWVCIWLIIYALYDEGKYFFKRMKFFYMSAFIFVASIFVWYSKPVGYSATFLDVGQGDCIVITNRKETYVVDGGGRPQAKLGFNTGARTLVPFLDYNGVSYVDAAFISHFDFDHALGILELLDSKKVGVVYIGDIPYKDNKLYKKLIEKASENNVPVKIMKQGHVVKGKDIVFKQLYPFDYTEEKDRRNMSLVLKMTINNWADFMLTGDITEEMEQEINTSPQDINAEILKLAHHGSKTSNNPGFIKAVSPSVAVASAGANNSYAHPSPEVVNSIERFGIKFFNTGKSGAIMMSVKDNTIEIVTMLQDNL